MATMQQRCNNTLDANGNGNGATIHRMVIMRVMPRMCAACQSRCMQQWCHSCMVQVAQQWFETWQCFSDGVTNVMAIIHSQRCTCSSLWVPLGSISEPCWWLQTSWSTLWLCSIAWLRKLAGILNTQDMRNSPTRSPRLPHM